MVQCSRIGTLKSIIATALYTQLFLFHGHRRDLIAQLPFLLHQEQFLVPHLLYESFLLERLVADSVLTIQEAGHFQAVRTRLLDDLLFSECFVNQWPLVVDFAICYVFSLVVQRRDHGPMAGVRQAVHVVDGAYWPGDRTALQAERSSDGRQILRRHAFHAQLLLAGLVELVVLQ